MSRTETNTNTIENHSQLRILYATAFCLIILWGLIIRLDDLSDWRAHSNDTFYAQEPLIGTGDGYYYLHLAQDLLAKRYNAIDESRTVPDLSPRPFPPPLLSVLTAFISSVTSYSLNWIAVILPAILGVLLALPLFFLGQFWGGPIMGLTAAAIGVVSNAHLARSSLGQYDTDCLNSAFTMSIIFCLLRFGTEPSRKRYYFLSLAVIMLLLFLWWWDQAPYIVVAIFLVPFTTALAFFYRPPAPQAKKFALLIIAIGVALMAWQGFELPITAFKTFQGYYHYIFQPEKTDFPAMGKIISEQAGLPLSVLATRSMGNWLLFGISVSGILLFTARQPRQSLFLIIPLLLALFSFAAERFMIFSAPVVAIGFGFLMAEICKRINQRKLKFFIIPGFVIYAVWVSYEGGASFATPFPSASIAGIKQLRDATPENAVIWTWCDNGYPVNYWGRRATTCDGQAHDGERSVYNAMPFATENPRLAANFIQFFVKHGLKGINQFYAANGNNRATGFVLLKRILAVGPHEAASILKETELSPAYMPPEGWLRFFFPSHSKPIYLFLDWGLMQVNHWIVLFGTWDISRQAGITPLPGKLYSNIIVDGLQVKNKRETMQLDLQQGNLKLDADTVPLSEALLRATEKVVRYDYGPHPVQIDNAFGTYVFDIFTEQGFALLMSQESGRLLFNTLFWLKAPTPREYFKPVSLHTPDYQIWEVGGDTFQEF